MSECNIEEIKKEYEENKMNYEKLCSTIKQQLEELVDKKKINLAVPIESRVKTWKSVAEKIERKEKSKLSEITDLCGIRMMAIFKGDIETLIDIIEGTFVVLKKEDTSNRLDDNQFGYGSIHFEVSLKEEWYSIPTLSGLKNLTSEIQVRTTAQHIWASASHVLQYKNEKNTPEKVRRSINRVAALLELVDLEFERVLIERGNYINSLKSEEGSSELNTDNLKYILDGLLPKENWDSSDDYNLLLEDLRKFNIFTVGEFNKIVAKHLKETLDLDKETVRKFLDNIDIIPCESNSGSRIRRGVFYTHIGIIRRILIEEYGQGEVNKRLFGIVE